MLIINVTHVSTASVSALSTIDWIVDTGATDHVSCSLESFKTSYPMSKILIYGIFV